MANIENSKLNTIPIKNLKTKTSVNDSDILVIEDDTTTYKIKASDLLEYIKETIMKMWHKGYRRRNRTE